MKRSDIDIKQTNKLIKKIMQENGFSIEYTGGNCDQWSKPLVSELIPSECKLYVGIQFDDAAALIEELGPEELFVQWFIYSETESAIHIDGWSLETFLKNYSEIL